MKHLSVVDVAGKLTGSTLRWKAFSGKTTAGFKKRKEDSWAVRWANGVSTTLAVDETPWASLAVYCSARVSDCWEPQAIRSCLSVELVSVTPPVSLSSLSKVVKTPLVDFTASRKSWYTCFDTRSSVSTSSTTLSSGLTSNESVLKDSVCLLLALSLDEDLDLFRFESLGEQDLERLESSLLLLGDLERLLLLVGVLDLILELTGEVDLLLRRGDEDLLLLWSDRPLTGDLVVLFLTGDLMFLEILSLTGEKSFPWLETKHPWSCESDPI